MKNGISVNDSLYCIKSHIINGHYIHRMGKVYKVVHIREISEIDVYMSSEFTKSTPNGYYGYTLKGQLISEFKYLDEFFTDDIRIIRTMKLEKLKTE